MERPAHRSNADTVTAVVFAGLMLFAWVATSFVVPALEFFIADGTTVGPTFAAWIRGILLALSVIASVAVSLLVNYRVTVQSRARGLAEEMMSDLMLSREQFRLLYESSPMPYFLLNNDWRIHNPNKAALRFFGGTEDEVADQDFFGLLAVEEGDTKTLPLLRSKVERNIPISRQEIQVRTLADTTRWVQLSIFMLESKQPLGHQRLVSLVDMTEAKEIDRIKTDFVSLASHQLRTPLTAIKWHIDLLLTSKTITLPEDIKQYLLKIYQGNQRMIDLVSTLLNVSRIEMGTVPVEFKHVSLATLTQDVLDEVEKQAQEKQLNIDADLAGARDAYTDPNLLRIAIQNLLTNAIRYTNAGGRISISVQSGASGHQILVADSGVGIPPEAYGKLFSKMYRAENAKRLESKGTGLGLYMTKAFVETIGGTIDFTSAIGKGTTFTIHLPLAPTKR